VYLQNRITDLIINVSNVKYPVTEFVIITKCALMFYVMLCFVGEAKKPVKFCHVCIVIYMKIYLRPHAPQDVFM